MRYSMAVTPKNYLLFGCHLVNFSAQVTQGYRFCNYWYMGGKEKSLEQKAKEGLGEAKDEVQVVSQKVGEQVVGVKEKVKSVVGKA